MMILNIPKRRHSKLYWISTTLILFIVMTSMFIQGYFSPPEPSDEVHKMASVANRVLVIRFPLSSSEPQELIIVYENDERMNPPREALRGPAHDTLGFSSEVNKVQLTLPQWSQVDALRDQWCNTALFKMPFQQTPEDEASFDIGVSCGRRLHIPLQELPSALKNLIETIPSPGCDDPFCGWQE